MSPLIPLLGGPAGIPGPPPAPPLPTVSFYVDPIFQPFRVGNGRLLVTGGLTFSGSPVDSVWWRINGGPWQQGWGALQNNQTFWFWVYGTNPPPWAGVWRQGSWNTLFQQGQGYTLDVQWTLGGTSVIALTQSFVWPVSIYDTVTRMANLVLPRFLSEGQRARSLAFMLALWIGDAMAAAEDLANQSFAETASWSIPIWEEAMSLASPPSVPSAQRQAIVAARANRVSAERGSFFGAIQAIAGQILSVVDSYSTHTVTITLANTDPQLHSRVSALIADIKPVGINVVLV